MASFNKIQLTGKLNDAPDVKATTSGHSVSKFTLIVPRIEALPNQRFDYIRVTTWRENADKTASFQKGDIIFVEGRILNDSYENSSGQRVWTTEVDARQVVNFNEVFSDAPAADSSFDAAPFIEPSNQTQQENTTQEDPIENVPIAPVDEAAFFENTENSDDSKNELEEDVPF